MKKESNNQVTKELCILIQNMNSTEKAYYKKMAKRHADVNKAKHLKLFDIIDKNQNQNIEKKKLIKELGIQNISQFSSLKSYLLNDIIDSLAFLYRNEPEAHVYNSLLEIDILLKKRLFGHAKKMIEKMKVNSIQNQYFISYRQMLKQEYSLITLSQPKGYQEKHLALNNEMKEITELIYQLEKIQYHFREMLWLKEKASIRITEDESAEVALCLSRLRDIIQPKTSPPSFAFYFHCACAIGYYLLNNASSLVIHSEKLFSLWTEYPHLASSHFSLFIESASIVLNTDFLNKNISKAEKRLTIFEKIAEKNLTTDSEEKLIKILAFNTRLKIAHKRGNYDKVALLLKLSKEIINEANNYLPPHQRITVLSSIAISYFVLEKFSEADDLLFEIKELNRLTAREDVFYFTTIFHLAIVFEKKEWYRLHTMTEAAYQTLYNKTKLRPFEKDMLLFLRKVTTLRAKAKLREGTNAFLAKMEKYKNDPVSKMYLLYFNYYGWAESKIRNIKYTDYVKQNLLNNPVK